MKYQLSDCKLYRKLRWIIKCNNSLFCCNINGCNPHKLHRGLTAQSNANGCFTYNNRCT